MTHIERSARSKRTKRQLEIQGVEKSGPGCGILEIAIRPPHEFTAVRSEI